MRIIFKILFLLVLSATSVDAQNDRLYTMFVFNKLQYNPAYAGSAEALNVGVHYRHQWQGLEGAPRTITAFAHTPIAGGRSGVGLSLISDEIGIFNTTYAKLDYAYRVNFRNDSKLSLGIFNFGMGLYYSSDNFYVGASVPNFLRNAITSEAYSGFADLNNLRAYYLMGGVVFKISPKVHLRPSLLVSYVPNAPKEIDLNLSFLFLESFWVGGSYRWDESIDVFAQFPVSQQLKLAVGVDYALTELNSSTRGSFEVMLEYLFKNDNEKVNNIRFF